MAVTLETTYHVAQGPVALTVEIGDGQLGTSRAVLGNKEIAIGEIKNLKLGDGPRLAGKTLTVKTVVTDVSDQTNHTRVTYRLKGGKSDGTYALDATVEQEGDSVIYRASFQFEN